MHLPNFYHACGIQIGITHSAAVGKAICEWITEGETEWDYSTWDPRRFGDWSTTEYAQKRIVELYDLQYAIPFPHRIIQSGRPLQTAPLYENLKQQGAVFGQIGGWERAFWFDTEGRNNAHLLSFRNIEPWHAAVKRECETARDAVGVMDHGGFTKYTVEGSGAAEFLDRVFCGRLPEIGRVRLSYMLTAKGKIWSEATIARLDNESYLLCGPTLADLRDYDWLASHLPNDDSVQLSKGSLYDATLLIMGPKSRKLLSKLTDADLTKPWMSVAEIELAGCQMIAMRVSFVGELGWELHMRSADLASIYQTISETGKDYELINFGSYALNSMRIEKAYHGWGSDFGSEYSMFDAGLEKFIDLTKPDFIGKQAVAQQKNETADWRFIRLMVDINDAEPLASDPVLLNNECVGYVTSAAYGYRINKCIALAYLTNDVPTETTEFEIEILGKKHSATICQTAFYDPENTHLKS